MAFFTLQSEKPGILTHWISKGHFVIMDVLFLFSSVWSLLSPFLDTFSSAPAA